MTVSELRKAIANLPGNLEVIIIDSGWAPRKASPLVDVSTPKSKVRFTYISQCDLSFPLVSEEEFRELSRQGLVDEVKKFKSNCIVLWPED